MTDSNLYFFVAILITQKVMKQQQQHPSFIPSTDKRNIA